MLQTLENLGQHARKRTRNARPLSRGHSEVHRVGRTGWLRAAVLGADDGIVSTASLMIGVAASSATTGAVLVAGVAGLVAGSMSMAAGEYVSVSSQRDTDDANIKVERTELREHPEAELRELAAIYQRRGLDRELALKVAEQLSRHGVVEAHVRDELGLHDSTRARPLQAALVSAASFALLAAVPILIVLLSPRGWRIGVLAVAALGSLAALGAVGGHLAGAHRARAAVRVMIGGALAMGVSALVGRLLGVVGL